MDFNDKILAGPKMGGQKPFVGGYKPTLALLRVLLAVSIGVCSSGLARADDLSKLLDWTFFPNEAITFSPSTPSFIAIANGGLHLSTVDQSDNVENSLKGWGFKKGISLLNTTWDTTQQWLTVTQSLNLPDGSVAKSATAWADMTGNVLLLHFDGMATVSYSTITVAPDPIKYPALKAPAQVPAGILTYADSSSKAAAGNCMMVAAIAQIQAAYFYCPSMIPNMRLGGALRFDGQDDELLVPNPVSAGSSTLTLEAWIYPTLSPSAQQGFGVLSQGSTNSVANYEIGTQLVGSSIAASFTLANVGKINGGVMPLNTWNHVVGSYDGSTMVLYVNGVAVATKGASGVVVNTVQELALGTSWVNSSKGTAPFNSSTPLLSTSHFPGMIDEVAVYAKALSAQDVQEHFSRQRPLTMADGKIQPLPITGIFDSRGLTVGSPVSWDSLSWVPSAPYGVQLPDGNASESGFSIGNNTLMNGNVLLLHLNELSGATSFADTAPASGAGNNGTCNGPAYGVTVSCPKMGQPGKFDKAATFNGSTDVISVPLPQNQSPTKALTLEAWVNLFPVGIDNNVGMGIISKGPQVANGPPADFELAINSATTFYGPGYNKGSSNIIFSLSGHSYNDPMPIPYYANQPKSYLYGSSLLPNQWSHVVGTYDGTTMKLYVNGVLEQQEIVSGGDVANSNNPVLIGMRSTTGSWQAAYCAGGTCYRNTHFPGMLDEVAIYNRALTQTEIMAHFVRGNVKPKLQIRFCKQADCSDMQFFVGPDLTSDSYFTAPAIPISQSATQTIDLTKLGLPKASTFQYQVLFESSIPTVFPSVQSVTVEPLHFPTTNPSATVNTQKEFAKITSFEDTVISGGGVGGVTGEVWYQFSPDSQNWFFCSGNYWMNVADTPVDTADISQVTSPKTQIQNCLKDVPFSAAGDSGTIWFRAFFHSPTGVESIDLNNIKIGYQQPPPPPAPPVDGTPQIVSPGDLSTSVGKLLAVVVQASIANKNEISYSIVSGEKTGMAVDAKTGLFTWTPTSDQVGNFVVTFRAADKADATKLDEQGVNVTVTDIKTVPIKALAFTLNTNEGEKLKFGLKKPDASKNYVFTCSVGCPPGLSVDYTTGEVVWTPSYSQAGSYDLQFQIVGDDTTTQPLQIIVKETNAVPQLKASGDKVVDAGQTLDFTLSAEDPDGGDPTFIIASPKQEGMTLDANSGVFSWVTKPEQAGTYIMIFRAQDNQDPHKYGDQTVIVTVHKSESAIVTENGLVEPAAPTTAGTQTLVAPAQPAAHIEEAAPETTSGCTLIR